MWAGAIKLSISSLFNKLELAATSNEASSSGGDQTGFLTWRGVTSQSGGVTNVLLVTTTMGMLNGVHSDTSHAGPFLVLGDSFVVGSVSLQEGLVGSLSTSDDTDHSSAGSLDSLSEAGGKSHTGALAIFRVTNDNAGSAGGAGNGTAVTEFGLDVGDDGTFGHGVDGQDVADSQSCYYNNKLEGYLPLEPA